MRGCSNAAEEIVSSSIGLGSASCTLSQPNLDRSVSSPSADGTIVVLSQLSDNIGQGGSLA